jgi:hypothetical protein
MTTRRTKITRRRSRFAIVSGLLVFALIQGAIALTIELWAPSWREPVVRSRVEHFRVRAGADQPNLQSVLFLGSSRFQYGIRVEMLERDLSKSLGAPTAVFNYGVSGANIRTSHRQWRHLRATGVRPTLAVVEVVPTSLHEGCSREDIPLSYTPPGELDWTDIEETCRLDSDHAHLYWENVLARAIPSYGHRLVITTRVLPNLHPQSHRRQADEFQDATEPPTQPDPEAALRHAYKEHGLQLGFMRVGKKNIADVEALLADLRADGVKTILLVSPEGPIFRSWYRPYGWSNVDAALKDLCARQNVQYVCARFWLEEDAFFDSHHMNVPGSIQFCDRLSREVLVPALRSQKDLNRRDAMAKRKD